MNACNLQALLHYPTHCTYKPLKCLIFFSLKKLLYPSAEHNRDRLLVALTITTNHIAESMIYTVIESVIGNFPTPYRALLEEISTIRLVEKEAVVLEQGKSCNHLWFINKGAIKAFECIDGSERVSHFFLSNMFFTNYYCWVTKKPSDLTYKAVEACELIEIDYPNWKRYVTVIIFLIPSAEKWQKSFSYKNISIKNFC